MDFFLISINDWGRHFGFYSICVREYRVFKIASGKDALVKQTVFENGVFKRALRKIGFRKVGEPEQTVVKCAVFQYRTVKGCVRKIGS